MANTIIVKRSNVPSKVPTTTQLALGEIAVNTYDGKLFIKKNDGVEQVVEVSGGGGGYSESSSPPASPSKGYRWLDTTSGILYIYNTDDNGSQWAEFSAPIEGPGFVASPDPPYSAIEGDEWLDTDTGINYRYFENTWVEL